MRAKFVSDNLNVLLGGVLLLVLAVTAVFWVMLGFQRIGRNGDICFDRNWNDPTALTVGSFYFEQKRKYRRSTKERWLWRWQARTFLTSGGLGTMGFGMGAANGACIGTGRKTVLFTGDGSFAMNFNELGTAVLHHSLRAEDIILIRWRLGKRWIRRFPVWRLWLRGMTMTETR